jgi:cytidyltransferase-like protein
LSTVIDQTKVHGSLMDNLPSQPVPKLGPKPTLLSRKEVDALYQTFRDVVSALNRLDVDYIVTGGSLLGAVRQHSILFCDDDIDIAIVDYDGDYERVSLNLHMFLGDQLYMYQRRAWEGGDRIRPCRMNNVYIDLFQLRRYDTLSDLSKVLGVKKNGQPQPKNYVEGITGTIQESCFSQKERTPLFPLWHFSSRKAIELWPKEAYRESELFPLTLDLKFGPLTGIKGPRAPVVLLKRAFGLDCFNVYYQSESHRAPKDLYNNHLVEDDGNLFPHTKAGGVWQCGTKVPLQDLHYLPMQPSSRKERRHTLHGRDQLFHYLKEQTEKEDQYREEANPAPIKSRPRPQRTVYMDGIFDLFHVGHLEAIRHCAKLGNRVIIGVTGDDDASEYKRPPIISQIDRKTLVRSIGEVDFVVCPCPLIVTESFMHQHGIDLVVHGFANDVDAEKQADFFLYPVNSGCFQRIPYYKGQSTTDIISKIQFDTGNYQGKAQLEEHHCFGLTVAKATKNSVTIPYDPFPLDIRLSIEPHIRKATNRRSETLEAIRQASGLNHFDDVVAQFKLSFGTEGSFGFDTAKYPLRLSLLKCGGLLDTFDLSNFHAMSKEKANFFCQLTKSFTSFHLIYDKFVREVCAPAVCEMGYCDEFYYQAFPCIRVVRPNEFSIGPHADVSYGHHPCRCFIWPPSMQYKYVCSTDTNWRYICIVSRKSSRKRRLASN